MARQKATRRSKEAVALRRSVLGYFKVHRRTHLPWRNTKKPYRILISEVMLQQTQADRVIPHYKKFLHAFPKVETLAQAPLSKVLKVWQGLGYNRRAKMLHEAAKVITTIHRGKFPHSYEALRALPGVGDYTAKAIRVFAFNEPEIMIETNIRTVFLHHFFSHQTDVPDTTLVPLIALFVLPPEVAHMRQVSPREWYAALMDYGSHLKKKYPNPSRKSAHHIRQKPFKGSDREIRGAILRATLKEEPLSKLPFDKKRIAAQHAALKKEGLL